jgi:glutathione-specific gamma-glutamylcyclotransferase
MHCVSGPPLLPGSGTFLHVMMDHVEIKADEGGTKTPLARAQAHSDDIWVFGYGSLMWNPGFPYAEKQAATAHGVHRRLCVYSTHYRGTPEKPGLVMGLLRGGCCHGVAFRVRGPDVPATRAYLSEREQISKVYHEVFRPVRLRDGRTVPALCYVVDQKHRQFAGRLTAEEQLGMVAESCGLTGPNRDYVCNTAHSLREIGVSDRTLQWLSDRLKASIAAPTQTRIDP